MLTSQKKLLLVGFILAVISLSGCTGGNPRNASITSAERLWYSRGISSYQIEVSHTSGTWHSQTQKITVRGGQVVDSSLK